jgi:ABC-type transport system involved in cytochrome bd biosynthesis fused ATPase/permease subunit
MFDYKKYWLRIKSSAKKAFAKTGLLAASNFSQRKNIVYTYIAVAVILTAVVFYMVGSYFTGLDFTKKISDLSAQLFEAQTELVNATEYLRIAENKSSLQQSQLNSSQVGLQVCQNKAQILQNDISNLQNVSASLQSQLSTCDMNMTIYQQVVQNSVRAVCCSFGDVVAGTVKNWQIFSNSIICSGNNTVNCGTGAVVQS